MTTNLEEFAAKAKHPCPVCEQPPEIRTQIDAGWGKGFRESTIIRWLQEEVKAAAVPTRSQVRNHFEHRHASRGNS